VMNYSTVVVTASASAFVYAYRERLEWATAMDRLFFVCTVVFHVGVQLWFIIKGRAAKKTLRKVKVD
jgi:hypothetical protein